ncbi:MAG TPA: glycosyltransferase family 39 protein [Candidatus Binatia bacterium]|nr:glycosyltransferase family 39 protein [Candidatus Binatia bacterium]
MVDGRRGRSLAAGLALALLAAATLGGRLGEGDLIGDPVIYAALAKAVVRTGDWGTLRLGGLPFFDKPPLVVWMAALSFAAFGVSTWSARLPGVAAAVLACLVLRRLGARLAGERAGLVAGAVLALTPGFVRFGSTLLLDPPFVLAALLGFAAALDAWERGGHGLWRAGAWLGAAFLAKGALALGAPAVLAGFWAATPPPRRPPLRAMIAAAAAFLAVALPWHLWAVWRWDGAFLRGYLGDVTEKLGGRPPWRVYVRAAGETMLPWLPLAAVGAWRARRLRGDAIRLLVVWTLAGYGFLLTGAKHSPRFLMLVLPALALWTALGLEPWLPSPRRVAIGVGAAAALAWAVVLVWPRPLHPLDTRLGVTALEPDLGPPGAPVVGLRSQAEQGRARFYFYLDRDVRWVDDRAALARLPAGTPVIVPTAHVAALAADPRFAEMRRTPDYALFRVVGR